MMRGKRFVRRAAVPFLAATTALGAAGASKEYLHRKVAEVRLAKARKNLKSEQEWRKSQEIADSVFGSVAVAKRFEQRIADSARHVAVQIPQHRLAVQRHLKLLAGRNRLTSREVRLIELGDTLGRLNMASGTPNLPGEVGGSARELANRLQAALRAKGYR